MRRIYLPLASLSALVLLLLSAQCARDEGASRPAEPIIGPIVVVTIDTLRADHLGSYGYFRDTTPALDRFAGEAVLFENAVTTMATTLPAHFSLWSSLYPMQTGVVANSKKLNVPSDGKVRLFAQLLAEIGYRTAAFVSANPVRQRTGIGAGFTHFDEPEIGRRPASETTRRALEWLSAAPSEPWFLWIHYFDPHSPWDPPEPHRSSFSADAELEDFLRSRGFPDPGDGEIQSIHDLYDGEVRFVDAELEKLLVALRESERYPDTTIVVTSDHGEGLGQHQWLEHGMIFNEQLFVPLIVRFPERTGLNGRRVERLTSLVDVVPTLVGTLGLPVAAEAGAHFEGVNVLDPGAEREYSLVQRTVAPRSGKWGEGQQFGLMSRDWKFTYSTHAEDELFDMNDDRNETTDLRGRHPRVAGKMRRELLSHLGRYSRQDLGLRVLEERSPQALEELRALGYVD